ncbi:MAG: hypothetical protein KKB79_02145 [Nanoarchaeota archaeon]|nr:hypothetical protein [Nanoarchaeota archaeon]
MRSKVAFILIIGILLAGFISAQINYSKCLPKDSYSQKKLEKSILRRILISIFPIGWVNWLTGYITYKDEINCFVNESSNLGAKNE